MDEQNTNEWHDLIDDIMDEQNTNEENVDEEGADLPGV